MPPKTNFYESFGITGTKKAEKEEQILYNLMKKPQKQTRQEMNHFFNNKENAIHQADLLFLPMDNGYRYALVVTDQATGKTDLEKLKDKRDISVLKAIQKIYDRDILKRPIYQIQVDSGSEFKGEFAKWFDNHGITIRVAKPARHRQQALVEAKNKIIGKAIFTRQNAIELQTGQPPNKRNEEPKKAEI